eukprot:TRINITY_DN1386_c0_g1_i3.p1 TRINITY_DN1386_c0_g1~~TRINITY_DN1386_c0_g1_i3.p1  ORF type:complete len:607 (+),score=145.72 TRINITY_DN1386_c0_g1_i3:37-1821(+)
MINFNNEVKKMSKISHPYICAFLGACMDDDRTILVTELCDSDLGYLLEDRKKNLSTFHKLELAKKICQGMAWLHHLGILHHDLKPDNILLDKNGTVKITDFGFSRIVPHQDLLGLNLNENVPPGGSQVYMAPERFDPDQIGVGTPADVYSFGIILWEILTRKTAFVKFHQMYEHTQLAKDIFRDAVLKGERPEIPKEFENSPIENLLKRCWDHNPKHRPSFVDLVTVLDGLIISHCISEPQGAKMWLDNFVTKESILDRDENTTTRDVINTLKYQVEWEEFVPVFARAMGFDWKEGTSMIFGYSDEILPDEPTSLQLNDADDAVLEQFQNRKSNYGVEDPKNPKNLVSKERARRAIMWKLDSFRDILANKKGRVTLERFGRITAMFGPFCSDMIDKVLNLMNKSWFRRDMTPTEAWELLRYQDTGAYILRFSSRSNNFVISAVCDTGKKEVLHFTVNYKQGGFSIASSATYPSIEELIKNGRWFKTPYGGGKTYQYNPNRPQAVHASVYADPDESNELFDRFKRQLEQLKFGEDMENDQIVNNLTELCYQQAQLEEMWTEKNDKNKTELEDLWEEVTNQIEIYVQALDAACIDR